MSRSCLPALRPRRLRLEQLEIRATPTVGMVEQNFIADEMEPAPRAAEEIPTFIGQLKANGTFGDLNYNSYTDAGASDIRVHARRTESLEIAYKWNQPGNIYYNDAALKTKIVAGWNYVANNLGYIGAPNWWWRDIGIPSAFSQPLLLFHNELSSTTVTWVLAKYFGTAWGNLTAANMTSQATPALIQGILQNNTYRIRDVVSRVSTEVTGFSGEGIARDLSFMQHGSGGKLNFSSGSYGVGHALDTTKLMRWTANTEFAFGAPAVDIELSFVLDHLQFLTRGQVLDVAAAGRSVTRPGIITLLARQVNDATRDLVPLGKRLPELNAAIDRYVNGVNESNFLSGNKSLWVGDGMLHARQDITATLKLLSNRTLRPETAVGENTKGFFEGDGMMMLLQDGDEYGTLGTQEILPVWDWQRLPGVTVQHNGVIPYTDMFHGSANTFGSSDLVGSVSDGEYGLAMMDYRRSGVTLTARKSWFFFDDEIVALGADIDDPNAASPVFTSLNQTLLDGAVTVSDANGGRRTLDLGGSASLSGQGWIEHDKMGYVLLDSSNQTSVQAKMQTNGSNIALPVFSAWIDHGQRIQNSTYAYAVVPNKTADEVETYSNNVPFTILANTANVQAVRHDGLAQTQIAFFAAGSLFINPTTKITVSRPCALVVTQTGDQLTITAADPRQGTAPLTIDVNRPVTGATWTAATQSSRITLALPVAPNAGASVTKTFTLGAAPPVEPPANPSTNPPTNPPPAALPVVYNATARTVTVAGKAGFDDRISLSQDAAKRLTVQLNGVSFGPFSNVDKVIAFGQSGNDMFLAMGLTIPLELYGNDGNDIMYGGNAADLLVGGAGDDYLYGFGGNDVILGGGGRDYISGDAGNDLLLGGLATQAPDSFLPAFTPTEVGNSPWSTSSLDVLLRLSAALATWTASQATMPNQLGTTKNQFTSDNAQDLLIGGAGADWFYAALAQQDLVFDLQTASGDRNSQLD